MHPNNSGQIMVLICDDEPAIRESVRYIVNKQGFDYLLAADGDEAIRLARTNHPDIILLDMNMPGLMGVDVCKKLKQDQETASIHIILLTANAQSNEVIAGMNAGANRYICKPFSPRELGSILRDTARELVACKEK